MGELVEFPFGARHAAAPAARLTPDLVDADQARTVDGSICATYVELLDDLSARFAALAVEAPGREGEDIWLVDARKLRDEIARRPANIRMAVCIAERVGALDRTLRALARDRGKNIPQTDGAGEAHGVRPMSGPGLILDEGAFLRDARAENEKLKSRLLPINRAAVTPPSAVAAEVDGVRPAEVLPVPVLAPAGPVFRARRNAAWIEACSAAYHLANAARSIGALIALGFRSPNRVDLHAAPRSADASKLGTPARRVIRRSATDFRPHPDHRPTGGSTA